jgi:erythritol transport system ATP-binding protein
MSDPHPIGLSIRGGGKVYPGTRALTDVDFDLHMGAVNVLVGENGAGKSTLMKVIAGVESLTEGRIEIDGHEVHFRSKTDAVRHGIGIVFQELNLFPNLTVAENIFIGREPARLGIDIDRAAQHDETRALMKRLEQDIDPDTPLGNLRIGQQQIVEIAKALAQHARILILDEPTSALSATEVAGVDIPWIVQAMIGGASKDFPRTEVPSFGAEVFRAENVRLPRPGGGWAVDDVSLSIRAGEIVGLYGLMGAGRTEFIECIMAQHPLSLGHFFVEGRPLTERDVTGRIARGIALIPEDRKRDGLVQIMAIRENLTLSALDQFVRGFHLSLKDEAQGALAFVKRLTIKIASVENPVSSLSGGNQQKVVIGKALMTGPKVLLMDEPSRGIDIGAKAEVFRTMRRLASEGLGILFVTSDLDEVLALSDRILVMAEGRLAGEFAAGADPAEVIRAATPHSTKDTAA